MTQQKQTKSQVVQKKQPTKKATAKRKKIILFVGPVPGAVQKWKEEQKKFPYLIYNLQSKKQTKDAIEKAEAFCDKVIQCSFSNDDSIAKALAPFKDDIVVMLSRSEAKMWYFKRAIPHVPYINTPTEKSLLWATDKIEMRKRMLSYDASITPQFVVVHDSDEKTIEVMEINENPLAYLPGRSVRLQIKAIGDLENI